MKMAADLVKALQAFAEKQVSDGIVTIRVVVTKGTAGKVVLRTEEEVRRP